MFVFHCVFYFAANKFVYLLTYLLTSILLAHHVVDLFISSFQFHLVEEIYCSLTQII